MANDIRVKIKLDDGTYKRGLAEFEDDSQRSAKKAGKSVESGFSRRAATAIRGLLPVIATVGTALIGAFAGRRAIAAAARQEQAVEALNQSLKNAGSFSQEASQSFQQLASELQANTVFGDEVILQQAALARNFTRTNEQAERLVEAATELSAATGQTLEFSIRNLGKTFGGLTGELGESLPQLRNLSSEALKSGQAIDFVLERFGGAAQAQVRTFSGGLRQLGNLFGDLGEAFGEFIVDSPAVRAIFQVVSNSLQDAIKAVDSFRTASDDALKPFIQTSILFAQSINEFVVGPLELMFRFIKIGSLGALVAIQELFNSFLQTFGFVAEKIANLFGKELPQGLKNFAQDSEEAAKQFREAFVQEAEGGLTDELDITSSVDGFLQDLERAVNQSGPLLDGLKGNIKNASDESKEDLFEIGKIAKGPLTNLVKSGVASIGASLVQGGSAFENFGGQVLGILGDLLINIGIAVSGIGQAIEALKSSLLTLSGGTAIAAGLALIALGGVLKGFAGGGTGAEGGSADAAGGGTTEGAQGGGVTGGGVGTPSDTTSVQEPETQQQGPQVAVNVQGDVLDSDETGLRIVDLINNAFDTEGATVKA